MVNGSNIQFATTATQFGTTAAIRKRGGNVGIMFVELTSNLLKGIDHNGAIGTFEKDPATDNIIFVLD